MKLIKSNIIKINETDPFSNDCLHRKPIIINLTQLIENSDEPFVLSISAPWGYGKTTFIKIWQQHLINNNFSTIYYNAWKNDFIKNPLASLIGEIEQHIDDKKLEIDSNENLRSALRTLKERGKTLLKLIAPMAIKTVSQGTIQNADEIIELFSRANTKAKIDDFEIYTQYKKHLSKFKSNLSDLAAVFDDNDKKLPVVFFIDELDRCHPDYVIELLEVIKHIFSINNYVFILAVDKTQLSEMIKTRFGAGMEPDGYLRRFIDLDYSLPVPSDNNFAKQLWTTFDFDNKIFSNFPLEYKNYFLASFSIFSKYYKLSYRVQIQCFSQLEIFVTIRHSALGKVEFIIAIYLLLTHVKNPNHYEIIISKAKEINKIIQELISNEKLSSIVKPGDDIFVIAILTIYLESMKGRSIENIDEYYTQKKESMKTQGNEYKIIEWILLLIKDTSYKGIEFREINYNQLHDKILDTLQFLKDFTK